MSQQNPKSDSEETQRKKSIHEAETRPNPPITPDASEPDEALIEEEEIEPEDPIQQALREASHQGGSAEVDFDALPEPVPELDEGPSPGPVDEIQEALFHAAQEGTSTQLEFDALPKPGLEGLKKVIRFKSKAPTIPLEKEEVPPPSEEEVSEEDVFPQAPETPAPVSETVAVTDFKIILALFILFRFLTVLLLRPGGFIRDWSDFDTYLGIATLSDYSLFPYLDFWLEWPPLIPWLSVGAYKLSLLFPPWPDDPRLWFILIMGGIFVLFEIENFILIRRLAQRLFDSPVVINRVLWLYAALFPPIYVMLGFFDGVALFFILLALDFLLNERQFPSAIVAGIGVMVKIIPGLMFPVAARRLWYKYETDQREAGIEIGLYGVTVALTVLILFVPFLIAGPRWVLASLRSMVSRSPWETIWAVMEGYYGFGVVGGDRLNPAETNFAAYPSTLPIWVPWLIALIFIGLYIYIFTRPADYRQPRNLISFTGLTIVIFMMYAKGYSPQFLVYLLPFILLLFPNGRGVTYALILTGLNILEQPIYFVMLPEANWLLIFIVIARFIMFAVLGVEFAMVIWPLERWWPRLVIGRQYAPLALGSLSALALVVMMPFMYRVYADNRLANSPHGTFVGFMEAQVQNIGLENNCQTGADSLRLYLSNQQTYQLLYPYLGGDFDLNLVAGAAEEFQLPPPARFLPESGMGWILPTGSEAQRLDNAATRNGQLLESYKFAEVGTASLYAFPEEAHPVPCLPPARFIGGIELLTHQVEVKSDAVEITLYWRAQNSQNQSYTAFTQLLNAEGQRVAGHDNIPMNGTSPTDEWTPEIIQMDTHRIELPPNLPAGNYSLVAGLYNSFGERLRSIGPDGLNYANRAVPLRTIALP